MLVSILTCTGFRPEVLAWCEQMIKRQTFKGEIQWIVVDDSIPLDATPSVTKQGNITKEVYPSIKQWREGINTQRYNMEVAFRHIKGDYIFVIEDDDWYRPDYIETMMYFLRRFDLVGQANSRYYCLKERLYKHWNNRMQCSLAETAMTKKQLPLLEEAINSGELFMDISLWRNARSKKVNLLAFDHVGLVTGMKQLPGRFGIGSGHRDTSEGYTRDPFFKQLKEWVGEEDAKVYMAWATQPAKAS